MLKRIARHILRDEIMLYKRKIKKMQRELDAIAKERRERETAYWLNEINRTKDRIDSLKRELGE